MSKIPDIYPLTICKDRYTGTYSGGEWTAWNCDPDDVPVDICLDDVACAEFWGKAKKALDDACRDHTFISGNGIWLTEQVPLFGVGESAEAAVQDLVMRRRDICGTDRL